MPDVKGTKFPYTAKGIKAAKKMAKAEGEPMKMHWAEMKKMMTKGGKKK